MTVKEIKKAVKILWPIEDDNEALAEIIKHIHQVTIKPI